MWISGYASKDSTNHQINAASLKIDPFSTCRESYDLKKYLNSDLETTSLRVKMERSVPKNFQPTLFCARETHLNHGACPGDSGGPMTTEIGGFFYQIGIIHGSLYECTNRISGIFVRLDHPKILTFITDNIGQFLQNRTRVEGTEQLVFNMYLLNFFGN